MSLGNTEDIRVEVEGKYCHFRIQKLLIVRITICLTNSVYAFSLGKLFFCRSWVCSLSVLFTIS